MGSQKIPRVPNTPETNASSRGPRIVYAIAFLDLFAVSMLTPLLRKQTLEMGSSFTTAGLIGSVYAAAQLISSPIVGDWSDRFGRTKTMFILSLLASVGYLTLAVAYSWMPLLFLGRVICGCFKHTQTLSKAYLADFVHPTQHQHLKNQPEVENRSKENRNFGKFMTYSTLGFVVGPVIGGHLAGFKDGFHLISAIVAAIFVLNAGLIYFYLPNSPSFERKKHRAEAKNAVHGAVVRRTLVENADIFLLQLCVSFSVLIVRTNYGLHIEKNFGISVQYAGYITSYQALLGVFGSACVSIHAIMKHYEDNRKLMLHTTILIGLSVVGIAYSSSFSVYILSLTVLNFMTPFSRLANIRQLTERSHSPEHHGFLMGTSQSVGSFARLSSSFLAGIFQDYFVAGPEIISVALTSIAVFQILFKY